MSRSHTHSRRSESARGRQKQRSRSSEPFEQRIAHWLLVALLIFMPLAFGAVEAWSQFVAWLGCLGLVACLLISAWRRRASGGLIWTPAYIPIAAFVLLGLVHALPVPFSLIELVSPHAASLYQDLRGDVASSFTLGLYPHDTWQDLCVVAMATVTFLVVVNFHRRSDQIRRLLLAVGAIGATLAILALVDGVFGDGRIYWVGPKEVQPNSGTFLCHNHFSQHMILSVMAMLAYAMVRFREVLGRNWMQADSFSDWLTLRELRGVRCLLLLAICGLVTIAMSASRMGIISAGAAMIVLTLLLGFRSDGQRVQLPIVVGIAAVAAILLIGSELMFERMSTLNSLDSYAGRWTVVTDLLPAFRDFPVVGSGLGTFSVVYPMYDTGNTWRFANHAENEYAQVLLETGIIGLGMVVWFVVILVRSLVQVLRRMNRPLYMAAPALAAGLLAVMMHSWTDFGQHLPAVASLSAIFSGVLVVLGQRATGSLRARRRRLRAAAPQTAIQSNNGRRMLGSALVCVLGLILVLNIPATFLRVFAEEYSVAGLDLSARLEKARWKGTDRDYATLVSLGERAVQLDSGNVVYRYRLGVYRWWAAVRGRTPKELGAATPPELAAVANQIVDEMIVAAARCPTFGAVHCWRGQMEWWVLGIVEGRERVEKGIRTARNDRIAWQAAGLLAATEGNAQLAFERFQRAIEVRGSLNDAAKVLLEECKRPDLAIALAGEDPQRLYDVSYLLQQQGYKQESDDARTRALAGYRDKVDDADTPAWAVAALADASAKEGDHDQAINLYGLAISRDYANVPWRAACIREIIAAGQLDRADDQIDVLERLNKDARTVEILRGELVQAKHRATTQAASTMPTSAPAAAGQTTSTQP